MKHALWILALCLLVACGGEKNNEPVPPPKPKPGSGPGPGPGPGPNDEVVAVPFPVPEFHLKIPARLINKKEIEVLEYPSKWESPLVIRKIAQTVPDEAENKHPFDATREETCRTIKDYAKKGDLASVQTRWSVLARLPGITRNLELAFFKELRRLDYEPPFVLKNPLKLTKAEVSFSAAPRALVKHRAPETFRTFLSGWITLTALSRFDYYPREIAARDLLCDLAEGIASVDVALEGTVGETIPYSGTLTLKGVLSEGD